MKAKQFQLRFVNRLHPQIAISDTHRINTFVNSKAKQFTCTQNLLPQSDQNTHHVLCLNGENDAMNSYC